MKSKAHIKGHPLHPILVSFPIAFFTGTFLADCATLIFDNNDLWRIAFYLEAAGICFAILAAIPGAIDYMYTVPPKSSSMPQIALVFIDDARGRSSFFHKHHAYSSNPAKRNLRPDMRKGGMFLIATNITR